jgi:four helix bundle protein
MTPEELKARTQAFSLRIIRLVGTLPHNPTAGVIGRQLLRSGTSVGANYRSACRARSRADFSAKMAIVEEEADETLYWLKLLVKSGTIKADGVAELLREADELVAIVTASRKTSQQKHNPQSSINNPKSFTSQKPQQL